MTVFMKVHKSEPPIFPPTGLKCHDLGTYTSGGAAAPAVYIYIPKVNRHDHPKWKMKPDSKLGKSASSIRDEYEDGVFTPTYSCWNIEAKYGSQKERNWSLHVPTCPYNDCQSLLVRVSMRHLFGY